MAREILSADEVDVLMSFIKVRGLALLGESLDDLSRRGGKLRVLTTTYMGATDAEAVAKLSKWPNCEVRVSYDRRRTRLHAKAWFFKRNSGFGSVYVGSANLSACALGSGLEWNIKATQADLPHVIDKFQANFEGLWTSDEFIPYRGAEGDLQTLKNELAEARGERRTDSFRCTVPGFSLRPYPFQQNILDQLAGERAEGWCRNLVVAATGMGKTMIAAFDYERLARQQGVRPRLLFVAHREELLQQALASYRHVLRDENFGATFSGSQEPVSFDHCFATIQVLSRREFWGKFAPDYWQILVVDEFHHAEALTYKRLLEGIRPNILLGLTATPERGDGQDILHYFDGRVAAEIRLWEALEGQHLAPFIYYGVADGCDLEGLAWQRGRYAENALGLLYATNHRRAELVLEKFIKLHGRPDEARILGFCAGVEHAKFMAEIFTKAGIPSLAVHGDTAPELRREARAKLVSLEINALFTCDLYNEGVDIPELDTLLFLRPTESAVVFQQQLGRGLRLHPGKEFALVLDFIGKAHRKFRFDTRLHSITGQRRGDLRQAIECNRVRLPPGCQFFLEKRAQEVVLENLRSQLEARTALLVAELRLQAIAGKAPPLANFLESSGYELDLICRRGGWTYLLRQAELLPPLHNHALEIEERELGKTFYRLLHVNDPWRLELWIATIAELRPLSSCSECEYRAILTLMFRLGKHTKLEDFFGAFRRHPLLAAELHAILNLRLQACHRLSKDCLARLEEPLMLHGHYAREEILAALGVWNENAHPPFREGVRWMENIHTDAFLVTLDKSDENRFSPTTRYDDYAKGTSVFHWKTQSTTSRGSPTGRRYLNEGGRNRHRVLLFVRERNGDPYLFLGSAEHENDEGDRPIGIDWKLHHPIPPADFAGWVSLLAG
ncbi:MAG: DUF3427 domain-containing protein [Planctomycetes bacterium]|nr:DUF3427 domain-containing protein [Planctomycetota bacterium]